MVYNYAISKRSLGVWQFLNLARFAKVAQKSHAIPAVGCLATCIRHEIMMFSCEYIPPNFRGAQLSQLELIREKREIMLLENSVIYKL